MRSAMSAGVSTASGVDVSDGDLVDARSGEQGQGYGVVTPVLVLRLPGEDGVDAVAVADVDGLLGADAFAGAPEGVEAPVAYLVEVDVEAGLVELDDVGAGGGELARLGVEQLGEAKRERALVGTVVLVEGAVDDGHGGGEGG